MQSNKTILCECVFGKKSLTGGSSWKKRFVRIESISQKKGRLTYYEVVGPGKEPPAFAIDNGMLEKKKECEISGSQAAHQGWPAGIAPPNMLDKLTGMGSIGSAAGDVNNRATIEVIHEDKSYPMHCFFESPQDLEVVVMLANAADTTDAGAAASRLAKAFITLTDKKTSPLRYDSVNVSGIGRTSNFLYQGPSVDVNYSYSKEYPPGFTQYKHKPNQNGTGAPGGTGTNVYIVYSHGASNLEELKKTKDQPHKALSRWRVTLNKKKDMSTFAECYQFGCTDLKSVNGFWNRRRGFPDQSIKLTFHSRVVVNFDAILLSMYQALRKRDAIERFASDAKDSKMIEKLCERLMKNHPGRQNGDQWRILRIIDLLTDHATGDEPSSAVADVVGSQVVVPLVEQLVMHETGGNKTTAGASMIYITGRKCASSDEEHTNSVINGWYTRIFMVNSRPSYYRELNNPVDDKNSSIFLYWALGRWNISSELGQEDAFMAYNEDDVYYAEAISMVWHIYTKSEDGTFDDFQPDDHIRVISSRLLPHNGSESSKAAASAVKAKVKGEPVQGQPVQEQPTGQTKDMQTALNSGINNIVNNIFAGVGSTSAVTQSNDSIPKFEAPQGVTHSSQLLIRVINAVCNTKVAEIAAVNCAESFETLLTRAVVRMKGINWDREHSISRNDVVDGIIRILHNINIERENEKENPISAMFLGSSDDPARILELLLDLFIAGCDTKPLIPLKSSDEKRTILNFSRCEIYTLLKAAYIPISFRHMKDDRLVNIKKRLTDEVTPILAQIITELADNQQSAALLDLNQLISKYQIHFAISLVSFCVEIPEAATKLAKDCPITVRKAIEILMAGTSTQWDIMTKHTNMTAANASTRDNKAKAYNEVLAFLSTLSKHVSTNKAVDDLFYKTHTIEQLVQVLKIEADDETKMLSAEAMFFLSKHSSEHCNNLNRLDAIPHLLNLLNTGELATQVRAAGVISSLLRNSKDRQRKFIEAGGCQTLVRLLAQEPDGSEANEQMGEFLQEASLHLTSMAESAQDMVDNNIIEIVLQILRKESVKLVEKPEYGSPRLRIAALKRLSQSIHDLCDFPEFGSRIRDANAREILDEILDNVNIKDDEGVCVDADESFADLSDDSNRAESRKRFNVTAAKIVDVNADYESADDFKLQTPKPETWSDREELAAMLAWIKHYLPEDGADDSSTLVSSQRNKVLVAYHKDDHRGARKVWQALHSKFKDKMLPYSKSTTKDLDEVLAAINEAAVVVVCCSTKFAAVEDFNLCRHLVKIPFTQRVNMKKVTLVPAIIETDFKLDSETWLGAYLASTNSYNVSSSSDGKSSSYNRLDTHISDLLQGKIAGPSTSTVQTPRSVANSQIYSSTSAAVSAPALQSDVLHEGLKVPRDLDISQSRWNDDNIASVIMSYCSKTTQDEPKDKVGLGKRWAWAISNFLNQKNIPCFHGGMVKGAQHWEKEWMSHQESAEIALIMLSPPYFESEACLMELFQISTNLENQQVIFIELEPAVTANTFKIENFVGSKLVDKLKKKKLAPKDFKKDDVVAKMKEALSYNMTPPPDEGTFPQRYIRNLALLADRVAEMLWG